MNPKDTVEINTQDKLIEKCIGVMGNPAMKGSYAAPREAFREILRTEGDRVRREILTKDIEELERERKGLRHETHDDHWTYCGYCGQRKALSDLITRKKEALQTLLTKK